MRWRELIAKGLFDFSPEFSWVRTAVRFLFRPRPPSLRAFKFFREGGVGDRWNSDTMSPEVVSYHFRGVPDWAGPDPTFLSPKLQTCAHACLCDTKVHVRWTEAKRRDGKYRFFFCDILFDSDHIFRVSVVLGAQKYLHCQIGYRRR